MIKNILIEIILGICCGVCTMFHDAIKNIENIEYIYLIPIVGIIYLIYEKNKKSGQDNLDRIKCKSLDNKRYSILLIDDDYKLRTRYYGLLSSMYEIKVIDKIDSVLYLHGFDIIIFDVVKTVTFNKDSCLDVIKILKETKPYKYVIAISTDKYKLDECKPWSDSVILKDNSFDKKLNEQISNAFNDLDTPKRYWDNIKKNEYFKKEKEDFYKSDYINTLKHNPHFN